LNIVNVTADGDVRDFAWSGDDILPSWYHLALDREKWWTVTSCRTRDYRRRETKSDSKKIRSYEQKRNKSTGFAI